MGHCVESGYGIVTEDDRVTMLDPEATPQVVDVVEASDRDEGIRLRATRAERDGAMERPTSPKSSECVHGFQVSSAAACNVSYSSLNIDSHDEQQR